GGLASWRRSTCPGRAARASGDGNAPRLHVLNLLVITPQDEARGRMAGLLSEVTTKLSFRKDATEAGPLVQRGLFDAIVVLTAGASEHALDEIRALRRSRPEGIVAVIVDGAPLAWEESALAAGADIVLREPITAAHLEGILRRLLAAATAGSSAVERASLRSRPPSPAPPVRGPLEILRDFSHVLG